MYRLLLQGFLLLFLGCASKNIFDDATSEFDKIMAQSEEAQRRKEASLPVSFITCPNNFYWSVEKFIPESHSIQCISAKNPSMGPFTIGWGSSSFNNKLSDREIEICYTIAKKIHGDLAPMDYHIFQNFDDKEVSRLIENNDDFHDVLYKEAYLENISYSLDEFQDKIINYKIVIPVSVTCENSWQVKQSPNTSYGAIFRQPEGKCRFFTNHHILELDGNNIDIALNGYYETDPDYPDKNNLVKIETLGFKTSKMHQPL